ncbi:alpha/beta hydrolase-fold protein [Luteolibacter sp. SL250]|uniref:alpha/beta hydrolase n=1 Tax=Luteolibacter sp. SL250 TaxID=2995170 RepID=UPI0022715DC5|nr:alpha/beta hydrolase-fold protein [Luteolibacter sp. SL250]WAC19097.1 alpha/beta hydrolase-fold protein [Luteolibacter sp. SL250]
MNFRILAAACSIAIAGPLHAADEKVTPYQLPGTSDRIIKSASGAEYRIMVSVPEGKAPAGGHPVTYLLDGDDLFPLVTSLLRLQAGTGKAAKHNGITPGIVVGIGYPDASRRDLDYTPQSPAGPPETYRDGRPYPARPGGGADGFFKFIQEELKPLIEKEHSIDTSRQTLMGNGYGGLFALHVLFTSPASFQTYVAASPSVWWNNGYILTEENAFTKSLSGKDLSAKLVLTVGDMEQSLSRVEISWPDADEREEHRLKVTRRRMVDNVREMAWRLEALAPEGLETDFRVFPGESHKSVIPLSLNHALPHIFPPSGK